MFYHEVSHFIKESLLKGNEFAANELETMADISALYIFAHVNNLTVKEFKTETLNLFRDRKKMSRKKGYNWYNSDIWGEFLKELDNLNDNDYVTSSSLEDIYQHIFHKRQIVNEKPKDLLGFFSNIFN